MSLIEKASFDDWPVNDEDIYNYKKQDVTRFKLSNTYWKGKEKGYPYSYELNEVHWVLIDTYLYISIDYWWYRLPLPFIKNKKDIDTDIHLNEFIQISRFKDEVNKIRKFTKCEFTKYLLREKPSNYTKISKTNPGLSILLDNYQSLERRIEVLFKHRFSDTEADDPFLELKFNRMDDPGVEEIISSLYGAKMELRFTILRLLAKDVKTKLEMDDNRLDQVNCDVGYVIYQWELFEIVLTEQEAKRKSEKYA